MIKFNIIVAIDQMNGIGKENTIPWYLPKDLKYFKEITSNTSDNNKINAVIMGRKTWESIPKKFRPLKGRVNIIISSHNIPDFDKNLVFTSLNDSLEYLKNFSNLENIFVIGGEMLYNEAFVREDLNYLYITHIFGDYNCDKKFPKLENEKFKIKADGSIDEEKNISFKFVIYEKI